jgi:hypothetical protein
MFQSFRSRGSIVVALTLASGVTWARTIPASTGQPQDPATASCFSRQVDSSGVYATGGVGNTCTGNYVYWEIPLSMDYPGSKRIIVRGHSGADGALFCVASSTDATGTRDGLGSEYFPADVVDRIVAVSFRVNVPAAGTATLNCTMPGGAVVHSVDYNP